MPQWKIACRSLARRPVFAIATIFILALGIGSTTTLFSLIDAVLWKPLPYPTPDRLVSMYEANPAKNQNTSLIASVRLEDWNRLNQSFEGISGIYSENVTDTSGAEPERLAGRRVAPRYFSVFKSSPLIGRVFHDDEEKFAGPPVAVINYSLWQRRYHEDASVVGKRLILNGKGYTIIGVMPDGFGSRSVDLWMPAQLPPGLMRVREARFFSGVGRMKPGVTIGAAQADLSRVQAELGRQFPATDKGWSAQVSDLKDSRVGDHRASLSVMFWAVVMLLLIACANAGGLMLGQLHRRERELAIRGSLGATRGQLVGVVMREVVVLVAGGAALGCSFALWGVKLLRTVFLSLPRIDEIALDLRALAFAVGASVIAAAMFGLAPVLETLRTEMTGRLYQATRTQPRGHRRMQHLLVASQFAVTLVLLLGTGLLVRSYSKLTQVEPGFDPSHVITFHVGAEWGEDRPTIGRMQERLVAELGRLPGVQAAGMTNFLPATGATLRFEATLEGASGDADTGKTLVGSRTLGGDYIQALRIPVLQGRGCPELRMDFKAPTKALVNQRFVDRFANGASVIGRHISFGRQVPGNGSEIIGVVADAKEDGLDAPAYPYIYNCLSAGSWPDPEYVVRTAGDSRAIMAAVRQVVRNIAPNRAVFGVETLEHSMETSLNTPRLSAEVLALFAATALVLAAVGLYSLVMLAITAQTKEIGLRVALGAEPSRIVAGVIYDASKPVLLGLAAGSILAAVALNAKPVRSALFGVGVTDAATLLSVVAILALVSLMAAIVPAKRAVGIDPIRALREE
ncbi:MAG TPA: ABC transporter permease [Bryobacteraceae bacterium]